MKDFKRKFFLFNFLFIKNNLTDMIPREKIEINFKINPPLGQEGKTPTSND